MKTNHLSIRKFYDYPSVTLCGLKGKELGVYWADAVKSIKSKPEYNRIKFCSNRLRIMKARKIKQLTAEECKKA